MAATVSGVFPVCLDQQRSSVEDAEMKKKQVALMEKLRNKRSSQHRSWTESLKSIRTAVVDRRLQADSTERTQVQQCLDTLQKAMKVISQQSLMERLESVARQQGLTFHVSSSDQPTVTLQADMFYVEIVMNKGGGVREVKVAHQGDANVCHELTEILSHGDFAEFTSHLEGLQSIYKVTGEKKLKSKAYLALQSLERDLNQLAQFQNSISGVANYIHKSPLGILLPRTAGKPMKLIYFVSPYDLLDKKTLSAHPMTVEAITEHGLGRSVTVCLEPGPPSKLQTMPLVMVSKTADSKSLPSFSAWNHMNSATLPACFVLVLPQPIPVAASVLQKIKNLTELEVSKDAGSQSLLSLILDSNSDGKMKKDQRLFVSLPDQHHVYYINGVAGGLLEEPGVMVSRIPFTHPTHVPQILNLLRQQLLFNSLLASCVRPSAKKDPSCCLVFEMTVISLQQLMVVFEHPAYDTMVTVDVDMTNITSLKCRLLCSNSEHSLCSDDYAARVLQRCLSLPILLWSVVRKGRGQLEKLMEAAKAAALEQARRAREAAEWAAQVRQPRIQPTTIPTKGRPPPPQPPPHQTPSYPPTPSPVTSNPPSVGGMGDLRGIGIGVDLLGSSPPGYNMATMGGGGESMDKLNNPLLANLLDNDRGHSSPISTSASATVSESPMLSKLLEDNISVATNVNPIPVPPIAQKANRRVRKRRSQSELQAGRSPKRTSDGEAGDRLASVDLESSSSPVESSLGGSGGLTPFHQMGSTPARPPSQGHMSGVIDLTDENNMPESSLKKLVDSVDSFMHKEGRSSRLTPESELSALLSEGDPSCSPASLRNNQSTGPKNENASTSPEGVLTGSGEVGKASPSDPLVSQASVSAGLSALIGGPKARSLSHSNPTTLAAFLGHGQARPRREDVGLQPAGPLKQQLQQLPQDFPRHPHQVSPTNITISSTSPVLPRPKVVSSSSMTDLLDTKQSAAGKKGGLKPSNSTESVPDKRSSMPGLFEKFDFTGQSLTMAPSLSVSAGSVTSSVSSFEGEDAVTTKVRLKLTHPFRAPHGKSQSLDSTVAQSPSSAGSKSSNSNTFDFRSDEEDDDPMPMPMPIPSERLSVYSSSPTRLQISSKGKPPTPVTTPEDSPPVKPEKYKRKDKGSGTSGSTKRKKDRDDSKKEKKKKKLEHMSLYRSSGKEPVYHSATIEGDQKSGTKLKIRVTKEPNKTPSPLKESVKMPDRIEKLSEKINDVAKRRSSSPVVEKLALSKQDMRDHSMLEDRSDSVHLYRSSLASSGKLPKSGSGKGNGGGSNNALSKSDPKLAKATIRLKPLNMTSTTSTSVTLAPPVKTTSSSRGVERQRSQSSSTTPVSAPTTGTLSLSSILPNAPTASSVASLPPIPKLSSSSSSTTSSSASSAGKTSSSITSTAASKNSSTGVNSSLINASPKVMGSPSVTSSAGGRMNTMNAPNTSVKASPNFSSAGANKMSGPGGVLKGSPSMGGVVHRNMGNIGVGGSQKSSGNSAQGSVTAQKMSSPANQSGAVQKPQGTPNQFPGPQKISNASNQTGGPQRGSSGAGQGGPQRAGSVTSQGTSPQRTAGVQNAGVGHKPSGANQVGLQKNIGGNQQKMSNAQTGLVKNSGVPNQNSGFQKSSGMQGVASHKPAGTVGQGGGGLQRTSSGSQSLSQKKVNQSGVSQKTQGTTTSNPGGSQGQKAPGNQGRSLLSGGTSAGRGSVRNNSVSGTGHTPPNHLPINRSLSTPGQRSVSGSSPRTPAGQSPSTPSGPSFPNSSPQRSINSSPSSISQRTGNSVQGNASQKSASSSQANSSSQRQAGSAQTAAPQRPASSPQSTQRQTNNPGSSPTQRPASTPGISSTVDQRGSTGNGQSPGYPVRPSSAGPRQNSSPMGSRTSSPSSTGQKLGSSPSRTSSPMGHRTSSVSSSSSPLISRSLSGGGGRDSPLSRQNSAGSLNVPAVSRPNSTGRSHSVTTSVSIMTQSQQGSSSHSNTSSLNTPIRTSVVSSGSSTSNVSALAAKLVAASNSVSTSSVANFTAAKEQSTTTVVSSSSVRTSIGNISSNSTGGESLNISNGSVSKPSSVTSSAAASKHTPSKPVASSVGKNASSGAVSNKSVANSMDTLNKMVVTTTSNSGTGVKSVVPVSLPLTRSLSVTAGGSVSTSSVSTPEASSTSGILPSLPSSSSSSVTSAITKALTSTGTSNFVSLSASTSAPAVIISTATKTIAAPRSRKGSLSAIVNKLAQQRGGAVVSGTGTDGAESTSDAGAGTGNGDGVNPQKVSASGQARRHSAADSEGQSDQLPRAPMKRPASVSSLSPPSTEQKIQRLDSFSKPAITVPTPMPTMPSPAHSTPPQHFTAAPILPSIIDKNCRSSSGERSSPLLREGSSSSVHDMEDVGLDLSLPKDKARIEVSQPAARPDSRDRVSPKESAVSISVASSQSFSPAHTFDKQAVAVSGTKFNGDSIREKPRVETEMFKTPTPKAQAADEGEECGGGGNGTDSRASSSGQAPSSPMSDASSPSNDLVIDCGESPNLATSRPPSSAAVSTPPQPVQPSPKRVVELAGEVGVSSGLGRSSPNPSTVPNKTAPSPNFKVAKNSPHSSPLPKSSSGHNSPLPPSPPPKEASTNSPCEIDDELMDEALGFGGS